ncbi:MAG: hypothetical protein SV377_08560, partial [Halobacteria archaeon]|nr:hypothetical protein [Halobacteria archaeon]
MDCRYSFDPQESEGNEDLLDKEWDCPHEAHGDLDYCLFHLPLDKRSEYGISDTDVREAFLDKIHKDGKRKKEFIGATFNDLNLEYQILESDDRYPIDLRCAKIKGELNLSNATISQPLRMDYAEVGTAKVIHAEFTGPYSAKSTRFEGETEFINTEMTDEAVFDGSVFVDKAVFKDGTFNYFVSFNGGEFNEAGEFDETSFNHDVNFKNTVFDGEVTFRGTEFNGGANVLVDDANFKKTEFNSDVDFKMAKFRYGVFDGAVFNGDANFSDNAFERGASFSDITCKGSVKFVRSVFNGNTTFENAEFSHES